MKAMMLKTKLEAVAGALSVLALAACSSSTPEPETAECRDSLGDDAKMAARTAGQGVETGAKTAVEGVKTAGKATAGMVRGGTREAKREWAEGKRETKDVARSESDDVEREANVPLCP